MPLQRGQLSHGNREPSNRKAKNNDCCTGPYPCQESPLVREMVTRSYDRGQDPAASGRQLGAIIVSGDRTSQLRTISAPTLVIHGSKDRMVSRSGGVATARAIPGARMVTIQGMGHDLPEAAWPLLLGVISEHAWSAERATAAPAGT